MKIIFDNRPYLKSVLERHRIQTNINFNGIKWIYEEKCVEYINSPIYWLVNQIEFDTQKEAEEFFVLRKLEQ
jgi:hypothetical protein